MILTLILTRRTLPEGWTRRMLDRFGSVERLQLFFLHRGVIHAETPFEHLPPQRRGVCYYSCQRWQQPPPPPERNILVGGRQRPWRGFVWPPDSPPATTTRPCSARYGKIPGIPTTTWKRPRSIWSPWPLTTPLSNRAPTTRLHCIGGSMRSWKSDPRLGFWERSLTAPCRRLPPAPANAVWLSAW